MYEKNHAPLFDDVALKRLAAAWNQGASIADLVERKIYAGTGLEAAE